MKYYLSAVKGTSTALLIETPDDYRFAESFAAHAITELRIFPGTGYQPFSCDPIEGRAIDEDILLRAPNSTRDGCKAWIVEGPFDFHRQGGDIGNA